MPTVQTLKEELLIEANIYSKYLATALKKKEEDIPYSLEQVVEIKRLINEPTRITVLHNSITEHLQNKLNRPFGEALRWTFSKKQYSYDLYNNLLRVLSNPKYWPDKLEHYEELYELEERLKRELREQREEECTNCHEIKREKDTLETLNQELQTRIKRMEVELSKTREERDQWKKQCEVLNQQNRTLRAEKAQCQAALFKSEQENSKLKEQMRRSYCEQAEKEMPKPSFYSRCS